MRKKMVDHFNFCLFSDVEICEAMHVAVLDQMYNKTRMPFDWTKKNETLQYHCSLVKTVFQPYDGEYEIKVYGSHIAIDRMKDGSRLGVVGITND